MYVAYGNTQIHVAQLAANGLSEVKNQQLHSSTVGTLENSRPYKGDGAYHILATKPASSEHVLKSTSGSFSFYSIKPSIKSIASPIGGGNPHQGGLIDIPTGQWDYMAFIDAYPGGRVPTLAPVIWSGDG
ncbi:xylosidase glycosyl hydrolase [Moniliophthora roreri MCA 2997]|nr:xylosidase glycosyl hydrolase [Moniliophthora roreri MCA 2997]